MPQIAFFKGKFLYVTVGRTRWLIDTHFLFTGTLAINHVSFLMLYVKIKNNCNNLKNDMPFLHI